VEAFVDADALTDDDGALHPTASTEGFFGQRGVDVRLQRVYLSGTFGVDVPGGFPA
jgi:hypothetical protein